MYKQLLPTLIIASFLCFAGMANAQADSTALKGKDTVLLANNNPQSPEAADDDFNIALLVIGTVFVCAMVGAAIVGSFAAAIVILLAVMFVSAGVLSASLFA